MGGVNKCQSLCCAKPENGNIDNIKTSGVAPTVEGSMPSPSSTKKGSKMSKMPRAPSDKEKDKAICQSFGGLAMFREAMKKSFKNPKDAFDMLDTDGNHMVSKEEWMLSLEQVGKSVKWDVATMEMCTRFADEFFEQMDINGDGELAFDEFKKSLSKKIDPGRDPNLVKFRATMKKSFKNPRDAFDMLDIDGNHIVTKDEWMECLGNVARVGKWDHSAITMCIKYGEEFFDQMDLNGNGELVFEEFKESLAKKIDPPPSDSTLATFKRAMKTSFKNPRDAFDMLDRDGSNTVSREEWLDALEDVGRFVKWDAETMDLCGRFGEDFFDQMDINGDGELAFGEFKTTLAQKIS